MIFAIDFDGVIHDQSQRPPGRKMGKPFPGAKEAIYTLILGGHTIVVHTVKARTVSGEQAVRDWLAYFDIPAHDVTALKPEAHVYIDDRAIRHEDWDLTMRMVQQMLENGSE